MINLDADILAGSTSKQEGEKPADSQLMRDVLKAARFMVELKEATPATIPNTVIQQRLQEAIDTKSIDVLYGAISFTMHLIGEGILQGPKAKEKSLIIVPKFQ